MAARIRAVRPIAPHLGQVEHLAQDAERLVRLGLLVRKFFHQSGNIGPLHVVNLLAAQQRDDAAVDDALIAELGAGLVALLGVVLHEFLAQLRNSGRLARLGLGGTRIAASANLSQPVLRQRAGLFDGQFSVHAQRRLAPLAGIRPVLEHEDLAAGRCKILHRKPGTSVSRSSMGCAWGFAASTADLVSLILAMMTPRKDAVSRSLLGAKRTEAGSSFGKHRHRMNSRKFLINMPQRAVA